MKVDKIKTGKMAYFRCGGKAKILRADDNGTQVQVWLTSANPEGLFYQKRLNVYAYRGLEADHPFDIVRVDDK